ncbi:MAG: type III-B CRISPR module RAMP protein Cmr6 [Bacillota bacterium]
MTSPLYQGFTLPERALWKNTGLLFDKFCNVWTQKGEKWSIGNEKVKWLSNFAGTAGEANIIKSMVSRVQLLVEELGGKIIFARSTERFITGTGNTNPMENGFTFHPILGTPYLPGSSLKGLVRSWMLSNLLDGKQLIEDVFGTSTADSDGRAGNIIFFDALPVRPVHLAVDVMTPHYPEYYQNQKPPGDWQSPLPIPFLTVDSEQTFMFAIAPIDNKVELLDRVEAHLISALDEWGAGAKTATGYGRFILDAAATERYRLGAQTRRAEKKRQQELKSMSSLRKEMIQDGYDGDQFITKIDSWLDKAETANVKDQLEIAEALQDWYNKFRPGTLQKPNNKNRERVNRLLQLLKG